MHDQDVVDEVGDFARALDVELVRNDRLFFALACVVDQVDVQPRIASQRAELINEILLAGVVVTTCRSPQYTRGPSRNASTSVSGTTDAMSASVRSRSLQGTSADANTSTSSAATGRQS